MVWDANQLKRTLYITELPNGKYKLEQFMDVYHVKNDESYREPIPAETMGLRYLEFDNVVISKQGRRIDRSLTAGQQNLINTNNAGLQSRSAPV